LDRQPAAHHCVTCGQVSPYVWDGLARRWRATHNDPCEECSRRQFAEIAVQEVKAATLYRYRLGVGRYAHMTLDSYWPDPGYPSQAEAKEAVRTMVTTWASGDWSAGILLTSPDVGIGKTHLAVALGIKAIEQGFGVPFYRLEDLLHEMREHADIPLARLRRKKHFNASYLVIDEVGFEPMSQQDASLFFRLVSYRYMRGSTAITTNKSVKDWPGIFAGDETMTAAILDRLLHKSVVLNIRGRSYRLQDLERLLK